MKKSSENKTVSVGSHVEIELVYLGGSDILAFDIVLDEQADFARGYLGAGTPLARAILGRPALSMIPYSVGDATEIRIRQISSAASPPPADVQERRQAVIRAAIDYSDRTNALIFASSFTGKWGDYDPTGFVDHDLDQKNPDTTGHKEDKLDEP